MCGRMCAVVCVYVFGVLLVLVVGFGVCRQRGPVAYDDKRIFEARLA